MDGNYDLKKIVPSLKRMCAVEVAQLVMKACIGEKPLPRDSSIDTRATQVIRNVELPQELEEMVKDQLKRMTSDLMMWHQEYNSCSSFPIWTSHGIVDIARSLRIRLQDHNGLCDVDRHEIACEHCLEEYIHEMIIEVRAMHLDPEEYLEMEDSSAPFVRFWLKSFQGGYGELINGTRLPQRAFDKGFKIAIESLNEAAILYFIDKASSEVVSDYICNIDFYSTELEMYHILPATVCLLFSKLSTDQQQQEFHLYSTYLLKSFTKWPFQQFFIEAASSIVNVLDGSGFWDVMDHLIKSNRNDAVHKRDYNYRRQIVKLWQLGCGHRSYENYDKFTDAVYNILFNRDELLIHLIFAEMSTAEKDKLLMKFQSTSICTKLIKKREFRLLELFLRGCCIHRKNELLTFKSKFSTYMKDYITWRKARFSWYRDELHSGVRHFAKIVDKIVSEQHSADDQ